MNKKNISVLWLDDRRNPFVYLKKKPEEGNRALIANLEFYNKFLQKYNPNFTWVKSYDEFKNYILKNGLPDFVSFDRDLGNGPLNGEACALWLVKYCKENGLQLPKYYAHTANKNGKINIDNIMQQKIQISKQDIMEAVKSAINALSEYGVYADRRMLNDKKKTLGLTYNDQRANNTAPTLVGDNLNTDKMENANGSDTYDVTLKNGFKCYNITSINGLNIMHYFKRKWKGEDTNVDVKEKDGRLIGNYKLTMEDNEWRKFINKFKRKVGFVVDYHMSKLESENNTKINGLTIYPVPSSSNFNQKMAEILQQESLNNLGVQILDANILVKDLRNLEKDTNFVKKNKEFYSGAMSPNPPQEKYNKSVETFLNGSLSKFKTLSSFQEKEVKEINEKVDELKTKYIQLKYRNKGDLKTAVTTIKKMIKCYEKYCDLIYRAHNLSYMFDGEKRHINFTKKDEYAIIKPKKQTKGPSVQQTLDTILNFLFACLSESTNDEDKKLFKKVKGHLDDYKIQYWEPVKFEIKNLSNGERMGLKGIYNPNEDAQKIEQELKKAEGTAVVVFDDNVSGGATLSDVCYQLSDLGFENLIPITFGVMDEKWVKGKVTLSKPEKGFNF